MCAIDPFPTFPVFVTFLELFLFKEKLKLRHAFSTGIVFAVLLLLVPSLDLRNSVTPEVFWGLVAGSSFGGLALINRHLTKTIHPLQGEGSVSGRGRLVGAGLRSCFCAVFPA